MNNVFNAEYVVVREEVLTDVTTGFHIYIYVCVCVCVCACACFGANVLFYEAIKRQIIFRTMLKSPKPGSSEESDSHDWPANSTDKAIQVPAQFPLQDTEIKEGSDKGLEKATQHIPAEIAAEKQSKIPNKSTLRELLEQPLHLSQNPEYPKNILPQIESDTFISSINNVTSETSSSSNTQILSTLKLPTIPQNGESKTCVETTHHVRKETVASLKEDEEESQAGNPKKKKFSRYVIYIHLKFEMCIQFLMVANDVEGNPHNISSKQSFCINTPLYLLFYRNA